MVIIKDQAKISPRALLVIKIAAVVYVVIALIIVASVLITNFLTSSSSALYIYMCGSSLESTQGIASRNISELLEADVPPNMSIIVQTGGSSKWRSHDIPSDKIARYQVKDHQLVEIETLDQASMGSEATFSDFLSFAANKYPARKQMLVVWDHGGGPLQGACFDENFSNDKLTLPEMKKAFEQGFSGKKFQAIGFDACLMADIEVARTISPHSDMLIASQAAENGNGWDYSRLIKDLVRTDDLASFGKDVCDAYYEKSARSGQESPATLSAIDLRSFDKVAEAFDDFGRELDGESSNATGRLYLTHCVASSGSFGLDKAGRTGNLYDLPSFVRNMKERASGNLSSKAEVLENELGNAILYNKTGDARQDASGLSLYYPFRYNNAEVKDFLAINQSAPWGDIISKTYTHIPDQTIGFEDKGSLIDGKFQISLTSSSPVYLREVRYILTYDSEERNVTVPIRFDMLDNLNLNNLTISPTLPKTMFVFNGVPVPVIQTDMSRNTETYSIMLMLNEDVVNYRFVRVREDDGWHCYPVGIVTFDNSVGAVSKDFVQLKEGDVPHVNGVDIPIGSSGVEISEVPLAERSYAYQLFCSDIFGKEIASRTAVMEFRDGTWHTLFLKE